MLKRRASTKILPYGELAKDLVVVDLKKQNVFLRIGKIPFQLFERIFIRPLVNENQLPFQIWFILKITFFIYTIFTIPLRIGFFKSENVPWTIFDCCLDVIFVFDMILRSLTPYRKKYLKISSYHKTCCHYFVRYFLRDVLIIFPFYPLTPLVNVVLRSFGSDYYVSFSLMRINRLLLLVLLPVYYEEIRKMILRSGIKVNPSIVRVFSFIFAITILAHYSSCLFFFICNNEDPLLAMKFSMSNAIVHETRSLSDALFKYTLSLYWSLVTMTGYGGTMPTSDVEVLFSIGIVFVGVVIYVTVIGLLGSMITNFNTAGSAYRDKMDTVNDYMKFRKLDKKMQKDIRKYYHYLWITRKGMDEEKILSSLPVYLRLKVSQWLNRDMLRNYEFFKEADEGFLREILVKLTPKIVFPSSYIVREGEMGKEMFFLTRGRADVHVKAAGFVAVLEAVSVFGEGALLTSFGSDKKELSHVDNVKRGRRNASIIAKDFCELFVLKKKDFDEICEVFPDEFDRILNIFESRKNQNKKKNEEIKLAKEKEEEEKRLEEMRKKKLRNQRMRDQVMERRYLLTKRKKSRKRRGSQFIISKEAIYANTKEIM